MPSRDRLRGEPHYPDVFAWTPRHRAVAEVVAGAVALIACVATSPPPEEGAPLDPGPVTGNPEPEPQPRFSAIVLHNARAVESVVRLRRLAPAVDVDCASIQEDPGALLSEPLLGSTEAWTIPAGDNLGIDATPGRLCEVVRIESDGASPRWLVWGADLGTTAYVPDEEPIGDGVVRLVAQGAGVRFDGSASLVFASDDPPRGVEQCAPVGDGLRLEWGDPLPTDGILLDATWGPDGCGAVVLHDDGETPRSPWFVCVPETSWPFAPGDTLAIRSLFGTGSDGIQITAHDPLGAEIRSLQAYRASDPPRVDGLSMRYEADQDCGFDVETRCGTVTKVGRVVLETAHGEQVSLEAGASAAALMLPGDDLETSVLVLAAQERVALDPECALGPDVLGPDLAIVITQTQVEGE